MTEQAQSLADRVYVELVRSLYSNPAPAIIMSGAFFLGALLVYLRWPHDLLLAVGVAGVLATWARILLIRLKCHAALTAVLDRASARRLEITFAIPTLIFASCLGAFGAAAFMLAGPQAHMLTVSLAVGYCAGVATGVGLRPFIAVPSMALAIFPVILVGILRVDAIYIGTSLILLSFFVGGTHTILARHAAVKAEIGKRMTFGSLARRDGLTALPNRLALREYFDDNASLSGPQHLVAVHYLDLDRFKPVNDQFGHAAGDALLATVAERLNSAIRNGDIVARLGGDEFAVLQFGLQRVEDADLLAKRASAAIRQPFQIGDRTIRISASIGTVTSEVRDADLDQMLSDADRELYIAKRARAKPLSKAA